MYLKNSMSILSYFDNIDISYLVNVLLLALCILQYLMLTLLFYDKIIFWQDFVIFLVVFEIFFLHDNVREKQYDERINRLIVTNNFLSSTYKYYDDKNHYKFLDLTSRSTSICTLNFTIINTNYYQYLMLFDFHIQIQMT